MRLGNKPIGKGGKVRCTIGMCLRNVFLLLSSNSTRPYNSISCTLHYYYCSLDSVDLSKQSYYIFDILLIKFIGYSMILYSCFGFIL